MRGFSKVFLRTRHRQRSMVFWETPLRGADERGTEIHPILRSLCCVGLKYYMADGRGTAMHVFSEEPALRWANGRRRGREACIFGKPPLMA